MAAGGVGDGDEDEAGVRHLRNHALRDAELGWIDEVVGGVDPEDGDGDPGERGGGVIVPARVEVKDHVIRVSGAIGAGNGGVNVLLDRGARGIVFLELERCSAGEKQEIVGEGQALRGFGFVVAAEIGGVGLNTLDRHVAPLAIAAGERDGKAGEGGERVGKTGVGFSPDEALHAAHGGAEDKAEMVDVETLLEHKSLRSDHVVVVVSREVRVEAVGGLRGLAVADVVGKDEEVFGDVERLAGAEEDVGEDGAQQRARVAAGAVEEQDGVVRVAGGIRVRGAEREVMKMERRESFAGTEAEVGEVVGSVVGRPV